MKLSPQMQFKLTRLNTAIVKGDELAIIESLNGVNLEELLSQETILKVRARGKTAMSVFLCTLAVANEIAPARAQIWLDCYRSITTGEIRDGILKLSKNNILRMVVSALIDNCIFTTSQGNTAKGDNQHWIDAFELALDSKSWALAVRLLESMGRKASDTTRWLQISKSLSIRNDLFMDESGIAHTDVDYERLARLYELCIQAAVNAKATDVVASIKALRARSLEMAGLYDEAIKLLEPLSKNGSDIKVNLSIARSFCKKGDLPSAINRLDAVLQNFKLDVIDTQVAKVTHESIEPERTKEKVFNIAKASSALGDLARIFKQNDLKLFLVSGTLLGYEREGKLLDHDKDIDIGVIGWENQYEICLALQQSGLFTISTQFLKGKGCYYIPVMHHLTGMWIDIFIYYPQGDKLVTGVDFFFGYRQTFSFTPFDLRPVNFLGVDMYVPENTDLNLQENFGNWRVSDPSYISHLESPSTVNKGGIEFMITTRMHALSSLAKKKPKKLRKVIKVLQENADRPLAMSPQLLSMLEYYCERMERESAPKPAVEEMDLLEFEND